MLSPIQVRRHWIRRIDFEPSENTVKISKFEAQISLQHEKIGEYWHVQLKVSFDGQGAEETNYRGQIEFEGVFDVHPEYPADKLDDLVRANGGAILYAATREMVLTLTSRSKHGPLELPTIDARMFTKPPAAEEKPELKKLARRKREK
jgi:preprotein translocase subunit SecB